jgi:hypothetical protein
VAARFRALRYDDIGSDIGGSPGLVDRMDLANEGHPGLFDALCKWCRISKG